MIFRFPWSYVLQHVTKMASAYGRVLRLFPYFRLVSLRYTSRLHMYIYIYLTAIGLTPGGSSTVHIYVQTLRRMQRTGQT
jgi:hypothetical protein